MTEPIDDRSDVPRGPAATVRAAHGGKDPSGDVARPTPEPRSLAEALEVDPDRDDVKG